MKNSIILFFTILISNSFFCQSLEKSEPNSTVIRLIILNEKGEVLLKNSTIGWLTISAPFTKRQTINEVIDSLSNRYGVKIESPNLKGVFTYKYGFKNTAYIRQLYVAKSTTESLPTNKNVEFIWAEKEEAVRKLSGTVPSLGEIVGQILENPDVVWGGSFLLNKENKKIVSKQTENFYPISNPTEYRKSTKSLIEKALQKYMEGSSYNKLDLLESAFTKDATLYLTNRDGLFKKYTPKEYAGFFKNKKYGEFNGRDAKVLAIEVIRDIATAKVEIAGPERKWVYIDLFLLKKLNNEWKIISKTATRVDENKKNK